MAIVKPMEVNASFWQNDVKCRMLQMVINVAQLLSTLIMNKNKFLELKFIHLENTNVIVNSQTDEDSENGFIYNCL